MDALFALAALSLAFLCRWRLSNTTYAFHHEGDVPSHDEPTVLADDDAMTAGLDIVCHLRPKGYMSERHLLDNLDAIDAAADAPLPLACRNLRQARDRFLARFRDEILRDLEDRRARRTQQARLAAHGL